MNSIEKLYHELIHYFPTIQSKVSKLQFLNDLKWRAKQTVFLNLLQNFATSSPLSMYEQLEHLVELRKENRILEREINKDKR